MDEGDIRERIAVLENQGRYIATKLDRMDIKLEALLAFKWRIYGATAIIAFVVTAGIELFWRTK
jgi:hypothetical protein